MAGHSHASNVAATKGKADAARAKIFTKLAKELAVAVKEGGADPKFNPKLDDAIRKAKYNNMTNDAIDRSIKKASGTGDTTNYEEITYEGYGINGTAVIVYALTDNRNRTAGDIRHLFDKFGGSLGLPNSVMFMFTKEGMINAKIKLTEDEALEKTIEINAENYELGEDCTYFYCTREKLKEVKENVKNLGIEINEAEEILNPTISTELNDEQKVKFLKFIDALNDNDDVDEVFHNAIL